MDVFISYTKKDEKIKNKIAEQLESNGISCWTYDKKCMTDFPSECIKGIKECKVFIVIISEHSMEHGYVRNELITARSLQDEGKLKIIVYKTSDFPLNDSFEFYINNIPFIEGIGKHNISQENLDTITNRTKNFLEIKEADANATNFISHSKKKEKSKKKKILASVISVILVISLALCTAFGINHKISKNDEITCHITIKKPASFSDKDNEILEERVKLFSDKKNYSFDIEENKINLFIPSSAFKGNEVKYALDCYITSAVKLYLYDSKSFNAQTAISVDRKDIESIEILQGPIDGVNEKDYGINVENYKYLAIKLTDDFINKNKNGIKAIGDGISFAQDIDNETVYYYYTIPQEDEKTFYIINNDTYDNYFNVLYYNLTNDPLSFSLDNYTVDINSQAEWQDIDTVEYKGKNQCNYDDFEEQTISISYSTYGEKSDGKNIDGEKALKQQLDAIGNKYAYGSYESKDETYFVIKTTMNNISLPLINIFEQGIGSYITITSEMYQYQTNISNTVVTKDANGQKITFISEYYSDDSKKELEEFVESIQEDSPIYVYSGKYPLLKTTKKNIDLNNGNISFESICEIKGGEIVCRNYDDSFSYLIDIFNAIYETNDNAHHLYFNDYQFNPSKYGKLATEKDFVLQYDYKNEELINKIGKICPNAKYSLDVNGLSISLNLPVDDNLVTTSIELSKKIYNLVDLENGIIENINIYFIEEDNLTQERGRMFFSKEHKSSFSNGGIRVHGIFTNGRLDEYKDDFKKALKNDKFFDKFIQDESSWTFEPLS